MKYPTGLTNSAMKIEKLENQIRKMHGDEKLKEIQHYIKSLFVMMRLELIRIMV